MSWRCNTYRQEHEHNLKAAVDRSVVRKFAVEDVDEQDVARCGALFENRCKRRPCRSGIWNGTPDIMR